MKRHLALLGALLMLCGTGYQAQAAPAPQVTASSATSIVTGRVVDEQGEPVIGASIVEVGTTRGTSTDVDGTFSLKSFVYRLQDADPACWQRHAHRSRRGQRPSR